MTDSADQLTRSGAVSGTPGASAVGAAGVMLSAHAVTKSYGGVQALREVNFVARRGAVNVVVGENGAGKSTLMKILSGAEQPTAGTIILDGQQVSFRSPRDAQELGIGIIHQELSLFPNMTIAENIFAGRELCGRTHLVDRSEQRRKATEALQRLGQNLDPDTCVGDLPIGEQQLVEIARVLSQRVRILIMDEPTSALSNNEVDTLFRVMRELQNDDVTIIYISHKLDEFRRIGDFVTVLRDGRIVAEAPMNETDTAWIVEQMVGRSERSLFRRTGGNPGGVVLDVANLTVPGPAHPLVDDVSLQVRAGEIVGIYGLMGAGRTELLESLIGTRRASAGSVSVGGVLCDDTRVVARLAAGLALVPEDRQRDALVQALSVQANILLATVGSLAKRMMLSKRTENNAASAQVRSLAIKIPSLDAPVTSLSGGNQQKVALARALLTEPKVLLLDEPTRGIDIGAKTEIFRIMSELADQGLAILFASSELAEITAMSDRVIVMSRGRITANLQARDVDEHRLVSASAQGGSW